MPDPTDSHFLLIDNTLSFSGHAPPPPTFGVGVGSKMRTMKLLEETELQI